MLPTKRNHSDTNDSSLLKIIFRFMPYWPLFSILLIVSLGLSFLYSVYTAPLYQASASILIQDKTKGTENSKQIEDLDVLLAKKIVDNETDVLISKPLVTEVINNMRMYAPVYKKNSFRRQLLYETAPVFIECQQPENLNSYKDIPLKYDAQNAIVIISERTYALNQWHKTAYGRLRFLPNPEYKVTENENDFLFSLDKPKAVSRSVKERLKASTTTKLSSIIEVKFLDENSQRAEDFIHGLITAYINSGIKDKKLLADNTLAFIDNRIKVVEKELRAIEQKKQEYSAKNGAFDISTQGKLFLENVSANDEKISAINMGFAVLGELENYVSSHNNNNAMVPSTLGISDPLLSQLVEKLYNAELQYESLKKTAGENNPIVMPLKNQIEKIKPDILELISNQRKNLQASKDHIATANDSYLELLSSLPKTERELVDLDREQNIKSTVYSFLLQKKEEIALSQQSVLPESRLVSSDISESPVSPNMKLIYLLSALVMVLLGMLFIVARESFGKKVMFRDEIEDATYLPVIAEISIGESRDPIVISNNTKTFIAEQFRRLRMTLSFFDVYPDPRKIMVTSAISGEGKSFIASNLALALALSGKKVALLDFDLNNPSLNNKLNISRNRGITDFLNDECSVEEIIHRTDLDPNLYMISTGRLPQNPTELLMNGRTEILLAELEKSFDYIVVDIAPILPVTDAYILSKFCDVTLYVVRHKYTPKIFLKRMDEESKMHRLNNVGIVFNSVSSRGIGRQNYGYGYGYGYSYGNSRKEMTRTNALT